MRRKVIQILKLDEGTPLFLCDDGTVWIEKFVYASKSWHWEQLPLPPGCEQTDLTDEGD